MAKSHKPLYTQPKTKALQIMANPAAEANVFTPTFKETVKEIEETKNSVFELTRQMVGIYEFLKENDFHKGEPSVLVNKVAEEVENFLNLIEETHKQIESLREDDPTFEGHGRNSEESKVLMMASGNIKLSYAALLDSVTLSMIRIQEFYSLLQLQLKREVEELEKEETETLEDKEPVESVTPSEISEQPIEEKVHEQ